jgi:hypothetical protein
VKERRFSDESITEFLEIKCLRPYWFLPNGRISMACYDKVP